MSLLQPKHQSFSKLALEIQEDKLYADIAEKRIKQLADGSKKTLSHDEFWKTALAQ